MRALVVFYSRTGNTRKVAGAVARELGEGAEVEELSDLARHAGVAGWFRAGWHAMRGRETPIGPVSKDPADFDVLVVGTPIWAGRVSSPVRTYLARHGPRARRVAFFCTMNATSGAKAFAAMAELCGKEPAATAEFLSGNRRSRPEGARPRRASARGHGRLIGRPCAKRNRNRRRGRFPCPACLLRRPRSPR